MSSLSEEIISFIQQNCPTSSYQYNPDGFPSSPFTYIYLAGKQTVIHCVTLEPQIQEGTFFRKLTISFAELGIKVVHLWEDLWRTRQLVVQSRLLSILGQSATIPARLCKSRRIDKTILDAFLAENHLQIPTGAKFKFGLYLPLRYYRVIDKGKNIFTRALTDTEDDSEELLIAVASFSSARTFVRDGVSFKSFEFIRFANLKGFTVVGGVDKLLKTFIKEQKPDDIMTYADADWSDGASYQKLGFEKQNLIPPLVFSLDENLNRVWKKTDEVKADKKVWNSGSWKYLLKLK